MASTMREVYRERMVVLEADDGVSKKKRQETIGNKLWRVSRASQTLAATSSH